MKPALRENSTEALIGLAVVLIGLSFAFFAWQQTGGASGGLHVTAQFPSANGISVGTDVRISGLKVGSVAAERLDPRSYQAEVTLALDDGLKVPADSSAAITTESLLGGSYVALIPGGSTEFLKDGDVIVDTQGAVDMMSLIGGVINRGTPAAADTPGSGEPAGAAQEPRP